MRSSPDPASPGLRPARFRFRLCLAVLFGLAFGTAAASAQSITIVDPPQWREEQVVVMETRAVLRVAGFVSHPNGVARVLVNGLEAMLSPDPDFPDSFTFEINVPPDSLTPEITISVVPRTGEAMTRSFELRVPPRSGQAAGQPAAAIQPAAPSPESTQLRVGGNPWSGYRTRGILYGAAVIGGVVLMQLEKESTSEVCRAVGSGQDCFIQTRTEPSAKGVGLALAGAGAGLLIVDAILTSRKARTPARPAGEDDGFRIEAPALTSTPRQIRLDLIRLRFR